MAVTIDEILTRGKGPAIAAGIPSIDSSLQGAPATVPGSGSGKLAPGATDIKGSPIETVVNVPAPVAPEIQGTPNAGQTVAKPRLESIPPELPQANNLPKIGEKINQPETVKRVTDINPIPEKDKNEVPKKLSYVELFQQLSPYKPPTPEELERERKKQKREAIFSAIGEGISALSNLYFTSQYAPNAFDPSKGMAATTKKRFDQLKKERENNQREYMAGYMRAMQMDDNAGYKDTIAQMKEREQNRKEAESQIKIALQQAEIDLKNSKKDGQAYINELNRLKGVALEKGMGPTVDLINEKIKTEQAKQKKLAQGGSGRSGGGKSGGGGQKTSVWTAYNPETGEVRHINATSAAHAWSQVPDGFTIRQAPSTTTTESTSGNGRRTKTTRRTSTKNANDNLEGPGKKKKKNKLGL